MDGTSARETAGRSRAPAGARHPDRRACRATDSLRRIPESQGRRTRLVLASALAFSLSSASWASAQPARAQDTREPEQRARSFAIPDTRSSRALAERADAHIAAKRWSEAISDLQELIEEHRGEVLGARGADGAGRRSQQPVHPGATEGARRRLLALPPEARRMYCDRYGVEADAALDAARRSADRRGMVEVARRWPLTDAARAAWWALGDLELELGNPDAAQAAWERARDAVRASGAELPDGAQRRLDLLAQANGPLRLARSTQEAKENARAAGLGLPGPDEGFGTVPSPGAYTWRRQIDTKSPFNAASAADRFNLFPIQTGDVVLVSTTMRLIAVDAWSGEVRWQSDEPPGWDAIDAREVYNEGQKRPFTRGDFQDAIDRESLLVAPAASGGIAVAALQIPVTHVTNQEYQRIKITSVIPDRRLFAYDVETGRELWNHLPPPAWDGEGGTFPQRMRVAGPPTIAGSRVLVPAYRMQGRIDYHVGCYDLASGALLWSTGVISGQRELNMFGRPETEFSAAPLVVAGDRVLALTQLGAIAALDLYTGELLWETLYDQIAIPRTEGWDTPSREQRWKNGPPLVVGGTLVATPVDSMQMIGVDLASGTLLWSLSYRDVIGPRMQQTQLTTFALIGAQDGALYLGGSSVLACRVPGAPRGAEGAALFAGPRPPSEVTSSDVLLPAAYATDLPRPVLGERSIVAPTPVRRVVLDPSNLRQEDRQLSGDWAPMQGAGNVLLGDGSLFTLSSKYLTGSFEWELLERRWERELAERPGDERAALRLAECLARHGEVELDSSRLSNAMALFARAHGAVEPALLKSADVARAGRRELEAMLFQILRLEARTLLEQADSPGALERLARARELAPDDRALRDTLLDTAQLLHERRDTQAWFAVLAELDARCGTLDLPASPTPVAARSPGDDPADLSPAPTKVGLWVRLERAGEYARAGATGAELEELHDILARYEDVDLPADSTRSDPGATPARRVSERILEILEHGGREAYAPFERRARDLLERARAENDLQGLDRVVKLFPHSQAALAAGEARLEAALASGDAATVVDIVRRELRALGEPFSIAGAADRDALLLVRLAAVLGGRGNASLERTLLATLARRHGDLVSPVAAHEGRTLREIAAALPEAPPASSAAETSEFDPSSNVSHPSSGVYSLVGPVAESDAAGAQELLVCSRRERSRCVVQAFAVDPPAEALWTTEFDPGASMPGLRTPPLLLAGRVVVPGKRAITALDARDGHASWTFECEESIDSLCGASGVVVASVGDDDRRVRLVALDAATGVELWNRPVGPELSEFPVCGSTKLVLLPASHTGNQTALVLELFTGSLAVSLALESPVGEADQRGAWIEGELLVLPSFPKSSARAAERARECVSGWDLDSGRRAWRVAEGEDRELDSIVRSGASAYLVFLAASGPGRAAAGGIQELDTRLGAVRPVSSVHLAPDDLPIGVRRASVVKIDGPYLFVLSRAPSGGEALVRAIHLPFGERWVHRIPVAFEQVYNPSSMALPTLSRSTVALAYSEGQRGRGQGSPRTTLLFFDRNSGLQRDSRLLQDALGSADALELAAFGDSLWISGLDQLLVLSRR